MELEEWLDNHPGYMVDLPEDQLEAEVPFDQVRLVLAAGGLLSRARNL
jgi:hypothetical protein